MEFNLAEKLAFVKAIDKVILADRKVANGELIYLGQLMKLLDFDSAFVEEARRFNINQAHIILGGLSEAKKHSLAIMLHEMAYADGDMAREEIEVLFRLFEKAGIKLADPDTKPPVFDIADVYFKSTRHIKHYHDKSVSENKNEKRAIKIEPNITGEKGYTVTTFKLNGILAFWGHLVEFPPTHMEVVSLSEEQSVLRGINESHSRAAAGLTKYGLSIYHPESKIEKIVLHRPQEQLEIEYLK